MGPSLPVNYCGLRAQTLPYILGAVKNFYGMQKLMIAWLKINPILFFVTAASAWEKNWENHKNDHKSQSQLLLLSVSNLFYVPTDVSFSIQDKEENKDKRWKLRNEIRNRSGFFLFPCLCWIRWTRFTSWYSPRSKAECCPKLCWCEQFWVISDAPSFVFFCFFFGTWLVSVHWVSRTIGLSCGNN